jgi:very-short-patch-repair endonuclease
MTVEVPIEAVDRAPAGMQIPLELAVIAADQHGVVSLSQAAAAGLSRTQLRRLVVGGWLEPAAPRVLAVAGSPATWRRSLWTGVLSLGVDAVVSHRAAAGWHRFDRARPNAVEFTLQRTSRGRSSPFTIHTTGSLPPIDRVRVEGLPVTSATRTVIDLARARVPDATLAAAIDSAVRVGSSSPIVLAARLSELRGRGRWGCRRIDALLLDAGGHSPLERAFLRIVREARLPRPSTQRVHRMGSRTVARVDFLFEPYDLVVEVSGRLGHASAEERARDAQRRNELQAMGRTVYEYTRAQVDDEVTRIIREVRTHLRARGWPG